MSNLTVLIRPGEAADLPAVHALVGELAAYEQAADAFTASLDDYYRDFADGVFQTLVAEVDGQVVGMMLYYLTYSTWKGRMLYLEDFVVREAYRGHGVGARLFAAFMQRAQALQCRLAKWQVLEWNAPAIAFYEKFPVEIDREWWNVKIYL